MNDQGIAGLVVAFLLAQIGLWADGRRQAAKQAAASKQQSATTDQKIDVASASADTATQAAELAAKRAEPVSNGFAGKVLSGLDDITTKMSLLGGELHDLRVRLDGHIGDHAASDVRRHGDS